MNQVQIILKGVDQFSATFGKATKDFTAFRTVAVSSAAAIIGAVIATAAAMAKLTKDAIDMADETGKAAQRAGVAVDQFSALAYAGKLADLSMQDLVTASKGWTQAAAAGRSITGTFTGDVLKLADQFAATADSSAKVALAIQTFGKSGQAMIPLLNQGSEALREQFEEAQKFGVIVGPRFAANAQQFNDALTRMRSMLQGVWMQVAERVLPTITAIAEAFLEWAKNSGVVDTAVSLLSQGVLLLADITRLAMESWITFTGLIRGKSFSEIGAQIERFNTTIDELRAKLTAPIPTPDIDPASAELTKKHADEVWTAMAKRQAELDDETWKRRHQLQDEFAEFEKQIKADELLGEAERNALILEGRMQLAQKFRKLDEEEAKARLKVQAHTAQGIGTIFGNLAQLAAVFGKKGFAAFKAFRIAEAIASTYAGAARALAEFPWPYSIAVAASVVAAGIANVATIASTQPSGQAHAGASYVPEQATYLLSRGERVLAPEQNQDLTRFLDSGSGGGRQQVIVMLGERVLLDFIGEASRNGRLEIDARALT